MQVKACAGFRIAGLSLSWLRAIYIDQAVSAQRTRCQLSVLHDYQMQCVGLSGQAPKFNVQQGCSVCNAPMEYLDIAGTYNVSIRTYPGDMLVVQSVGNAKPASLQTRSIAPGLVPSHQLLRLHQCIQDAEGVPCHHKRLRFVGCACVAPRVAARQNIDLPR